MVELSAFMCTHMRDQSLFQFCIKGKIGSAVSVPPRHNQCRVRHFSGLQPDDGDGGAFSYADWAPGGVFVGGAVGLGHSWQESITKLRHGFPHISRENETE